MLGSGVGILMVAYAVFLLAVARGVWRGRRWSRAPAIATQLIQLPIAWSFHGGQTTWFSYLLGAFSLTVVICLLMPSSTKIFLGNQGADQDPGQ